MVDGVLCRHCGTVKPRSECGNISNGERSGGMPRGRCRACHTAMYGAATGYVAPWRRPQRARGDAIRQGKAERLRQKQAEAEAHAEAKRRQQAELERLVVERGVLCRTCGETKTADEFYHFCLGQRSPDGPHGMCKACQISTYSRANGYESPSDRAEREARAATRAERVAARLRKCKRCGHRKPGSEFGPPDRPRRIVAQRCLACEEEVRSRPAARKVCRRCDVPLDKPLGYQWICLTCKEAEKAVWRNERTRRLQASADGTATFGTIVRILRSARACSYCGEPLPARKPHIDHIRPIAGGGFHGEANLLPACKGCNMAKRDMPFDEWLERLREPFRSRCARLYRRRFGVDPRQRPLL